MRPPWNLLEQLTPFHAAWNTDGVLIRLSPLLHQLWQTNAPLEDIAPKLQMIRPFTGIIRRDWFSELTNLNLQVTHFMAL